MTSRVFLYVGCALLGCSASTEPLSDSEWIATLRALERWNAAAITNYTIEERRLCFCPPGSDRWTRVTVHNGSVVSAVDVESGTPVTIVGRLTVPQMFEVIENNRRQDYLQDVTVQFHDRFGYPTLIELKSKPNVADGGLIIHARNIVPL